MRASLRTNTNTVRSRYLADAKADVRLESLGKSARNEVLAFLSMRPIHTAYLSGLIHDNGLESPLNRGEFLGCRNYLGQLEGVALIGHATLMETVTDRALEAFAEAAQSHRTAHLIMCDENRIDKFWGFYAQAGQEMRGACRELLLELRWPIEVSKQLCQLRRATPEDLELLIPVHAEMAFEESGVNPWVLDPNGFMSRYARRINQGRTWVVTEEEKLIFKADVISESPATTYIEGVWVNPETRGQGYGGSCMSQLARMLLWRTKSICLLVNDENEEARRFYRQAGYHLRAVYDTIFLK
jgi:predicted GNAT family acetyltransferase